MNQPPAPSSAPDAEMPLLAGHAKLTCRERELLTGLLQGWSLARIAVQNQLSPATVKTYRDRIYRKLDVHSVRELRQYLTNLPPRTAANALSLRLDLALMNLDLAENQAGVIAILANGAKACAQASQSGIWRIAAQEPLRLIAWNDAGRILSPNRKLLDAIFVKGYMLAPATQWRREEDAWRTLQTSRQAMAVALDLPPHAGLLIVSDSLADAFNLVRLSALALLARAAECRYIALRDF